MGDLGHKNKNSGKKRVGAQRGRRNEKRELLAWLPDGYLPSASLRNIVNKRFLASSFAMSNIESFIIAPDVKTIEMQRAMKMVGDSISDPGQCIVEITGPLKGSPYWESDMSIVIDGELRETNIESVDANELMSLSLYWMNQQVER